MLTGTCDRRMHTADENTPTQAPEEAQPMDKRESDDMDHTGHWPHAYMQGARGRVRAQGMETTTKGVHASHQCFQSMHQAQKQNRCVL